MKHVYSLQSFSVRGLVFAYSESPRKLLENASELTGFDNITITTDELENGLLEIEKQTGKYAHVNVVTSTPSGFAGFVRLCKHELI